MTKTYLDKQMENKEFKEKFNIEYEELCDKLENGTPAEKNDAELTLLGRLLYFEGD